MLSYLIPSFLVGVGLACLSKHAQEHPDELTAAIEDLRKAERLEMIKKAQENKIIDEIKTTLILEGQEPSIQLAAEQAVFEAVKEKGIYTEFPMLVDDDYPRKNKTRKTYADNACKSKKKKLVKEIHSILPETNSEVARTMLIA